MWRNWGPRAARAPFVRGDEATIRRDVEALPEPWREIFPEAGAQPRLMIQLLVVSVIWALSFGLTAQVSGLGAPFVTAARTVLAALVFLPFLRVKGLSMQRALMFAGIGPCNSA